MNDDRWSQGLWRASGPLRPHQDRENSVNEISDDELLAGALRAASHKIAVGCVRFKLAILKGLAVAFAAALGAHAAAKLLVLLAGLAG